MAILLAIGLISCGEYKGPIHSSDVGQTEADGSGAQTSSETGEDDDAFSVQLMLNGAPFDLLEILGVEMNVQWSDGQSVYVAPVDNVGKASVTGLDGDYQVTLSNIPDGFSYNPNVHVATNDNRHIIINLYELDRLGRGGDDLYRCIDLNKPGMYQIEITDAKQVVLFQFLPTTNGVYSIESWMDVTANDVNPKIDVYNGSTQFKRFSHTLDDGGFASYYTKNFKYEVKVADEGIGQAFTFGVKCDAKEESQYPIKVNFVIQLDGGFSMTRRQATIMIPEHPGIYTDAQRAYLAAHPTEGKTLVGLETQMEGYKLFEGKNYGYNEETGFYHKLNEATGKFDGPVVYAYISQPCRFIDKAFNMIEYEGNKNLTINNATENYKLFIEGYGALKNNNYFCVAECPCIKENNGACAPDEFGNKCQDCHENCNPCPAEGIGHIGYANVANIDGACPVTQELKDFLQKLSMAQKYINDGNGRVDNHAEHPVEALDEDQWMFACGYYVDQE